MRGMAFAIGKGNTSVPGRGCGFIPNPKLKLLDQVSEVMRFKHYSIRTETTYRDWIKRFIFFHGKRHPRLKLSVWSHANSWRNPQGTPRRETASARSRRSASSRNSWKYRSRGRPTAQSNAATAISLRLRLRITKNSGRAAGECA